MTFTRFSSLLILLLVYTACNNSPDYIDLENEKEVRNALSTSWEAEYIETGSNRVKVPEGQISQMTLNKNGTYSGGVKDGVMKENGKWNYDPSTHMLNMSVENNMQGSRIIKLTEKELIITGYTTSNNVIVDSMILTMKKL